MDASSLDLLALTVTDLRFRTSRDGSHQYVHTNVPGPHRISPDDYLAWRDALQTLGYTRTFSGTAYRYLDMPDGFTYWQMPGDLNANPHRDKCVLNRRPT